MKAKPRPHGKASPLRFRKALSLPGMLRQVRSVFGKIVDTYKGTGYALSDVLMSGLAIFGLKYASLLQFDEKRTEPRIRANLARLYGVKQAPCDTQLRERLNVVEPEAIRPAFIALHQQLQRQKVLQDYNYLGGLLLSIDGTGQFSSNTIHCPECCERERKDGHTEYYHQLLGAAIVHPDKRQVLPLFPETMTRQDGSRKNDCELNAAKRLLPAIREAFAQRRFTVLEDDLYSNGPHINQLILLGFSFIIVAKLGSHEFLFTQVNRRLVAGETEEFEQPPDRHGVTRQS